MPTKSFCGLLIVLIFANHVFATDNSVDEEFKHELRLSATAGSLTFGEDVTTFEVHGDYGYLIQPSLQVLGKADIAYTDPDHGSSSTTWTLRGGAAYNFPEGEAMYRRFYAGATLGFRRTDNGRDEETDVIFGILFGKRFPISKKLTYSPQVEFLIADGDDEFRIDFLSFSYFF